jgi:hypothetical protein
MAAEGRDVHRYFRTLGPDHGLARPGLGQATIRWEIIGRRFVRGGPHRLRQMAGR